MRRLSHLHSAGRGTTCVSRALLSSSILSQQKLRVRGDQRIETHVWVLTALWSVPAAIAAKQERRHFPTGPLGFNKIPLSILTTPFEAGLTLVVRQRNVLFWGLYGCVALYPYF